MHKINLDVFIGENGKSPYKIWLKSLDTKTRTRISNRIGRIYEGNFGDHKLLQEGIWELKLNFGPGYRIYFGKEQDTIVILLAGGDKSSQKKDIENAKKYWNKHLKK